MYYCINKIFLCSHKLSFGLAHQRFLRSHKPIDISKASQSQVTIDPKLGLRNPQGSTVLYMCIL